MSTSSTDVVTDVSDREMHPSMSTTTGSYHCQRTTSLRGQTVGRRRWTCNGEYTVVHLAFVAFGMFYCSAVVWSNYIMPLASSDQSCCVITKSSDTEVESVLGDNVIDYRMTWLGLSLTAAHLWCRTFLLFYAVLLHVWLRALDDSLALLVGSSVTLLKLSSLKWCWCVEWNV